MKRAGFSLLELVMAMALMALLLGLGMVNMRTGVAGADSRALATAVAAELRLARQQAITSQQPVAVVLPSRNGTLPWSQGVYIATGESTAHIARAVNFSHEQPAAILFEGVWPLTSGTASVIAPANGDRSSAFNVTAWLPASMQQDYAFVFTPTGGVVSQGLPMFDGAYHMVASAGGSFAAGSPFFTPTRLGRPWTVTLESSGEVSLSAGLLKQDGSVAVTSTQAIPANANPLPAVTALAASSPTVQALAILPAPVNATLPPGTDLAVTPGGIYTLAVNATDSSGRDLYVQWSGDGGNFTFPTPERMTWDSALQLWTSRWQWSPPVNPVSTDVYHINCSLGDGVTMGVVPSGALTVRPISKSTLVWNHAGKIRKANGDGTGVIELSPALGMTAAISADGSRIVADLPGQGYRVMSRDGTVLFTSIPNYWSNGNQGTLSPDGTRLMFAQMPIGMTGSYCLGTCDLNGANVTAVESPRMGKWWQVPRWSPDQTQVLFMEAFVGSLSVGNVTGPPSVRVLTSRVARGFDWQPNSPWIYYTSQSGELFKVNSDGTGDVQVSNFGAAGINAVEMSIAPDGNQLVFVNRNDSNNLWIANIDASNPVRITSDGGNAWPTWGR